MTWILYTRSGCHLCEDAAEWLSELAVLYNTSLDMRDILADFHLYEQYKWRIPVLQIGNHIWEAPLDPEQIRAEIANLG